MDFYMYWQPSLVLNYSLSTTNFPYLMISLMVPAPTVLPPSRMANLSPFSMATGVCSVTSSSTLSPGITISCRRAVSPSRSRRWCGSRTAAGSRRRTRMPPALFLAQHVHAALKLVCGVIDPGLAKHAALHVFLGRAAQQNPALSPARPSSSCFLNISTRCTPSAASRGSPRSPPARPLHLPARCAR